MRALRALGSGLVELVDAPEPVVADGEVLVRVEASVLCGSERGVFEGGSLQNAGHEAAGVVVEAPSGDVSVGDRVGISAVRGCGQCANCAAGLETRCEAGPTIATGMHAEFVVAPVSALRRVPDGTGASDAALMTGDALGVPVRALHRAPHEPGSTVVVIGLGPVGLSHVLVRTFHGARVIGVDPSPYRRDLAARCGAHEALDVDRPIPSAPLVIEATGNPACIASAFAAATPGGTVLQSGECSTVEINPSSVIVHREVTYVGAWYYTSSDYPEMIRAVEEGLEINKLVTHEVPASDAQSAVTDFLEARSGKVALRWDG